MKQQQEILQYSMVEFNLHNATASNVVVNLFDPNTAQISETNGAGAFPNTLGQQIALAAAYDGICYDSTRKTIITGDAAGNIRIINTLTGLVIFSTTCTVAPIKMIYIPTTDTIYAIGVLTADKSQNKVAVINAADGVQITTITIPIGGGNMSDIAYSTTSNKVYVKDRSADQKLWVLNPTTNAVTTSITMPTGSFSSGITYVSSNNSIYVFEQVLSTVMQVSCVTDTITDTIVAAGRAMIGIYNSVNDQIYYQDLTAGLIKIIDVATNIIDATTSIAGFGGTITDMAYSSVSNNIWATDGTAFNINIVDASLNTTTTLAIGASFGSGNLTYADDINTLYATPDVTGVSTYIQQITASGNRFYIDGTISYNQFVSDILANPKKIDLISIHAESNSNLNNSLKFNYLAATGKAASFYKIPKNLVSVMQKQAQIAQLAIKDFILSVSTNITYTIPAFTNITWIIYYHEFELSKIFAGKVMINEFNEKNNTPIETKQDLEQTASWVNFMETNNWIKN